MSNNCTTNHAIIFFLLLSFLLVYSHAFFSSSSKPTKPKPTTPSCSPPITLFLAFFSGALISLLCILSNTFKALFTNRVKTTETSPPPPPIVRYHAFEGGISTSILNTLPIFAYCAEKRQRFGNEGVECPICLSKFLNEQILRWLPDCDHLFHKGCIDKWLVCNKTCPCCRANVERDEKEAKMPEEDDRRRIIGCERSGVSGLIRGLMGRRRNNDNRHGHR